jgi:hypothetical protein
VTIDNLEINNLEIKIATLTEIVLADPRISKKSKTIISDHILDLQETYLKETGHYYTDMENKMKKKRDHCYTIK